MNKISRKIRGCIYGKKGQAQLEETPEEKWLSIGLLALLVILVIVGCYLLYHFLIKEGQLASLFSGMRRYP